MTTTTTTKLLLLASIVSFFFLGNIQAVVVVPQDEITPDKRPPRNDKPQREHPYVTDNPGPHRPGRHLERGSVHHGAHFPHHGRKLNAFIEDGSMLDDIEVKFQEFTSNRDRRRFLRHVQRVADCGRAQKMFRLESIREYRKQQIKDGLHLWFTFPNCRGTSIYKPNNAFDRDDPDNNNDVITGPLKEGEGARQAIHNLMDALDIEGPEAFHMQTVGPQFKVRLLGWKADVPPIQFLYEEDLPQHLRGKLGGAKQNQQQQPHNQTSSRRLDYVPNDPFYTSSNPDYMGHLSLIGVPEAWDMVDFSEAADVVAHVLDTGLDVNHEDLAENVWVNPNDPCGGGDNDGQFGDDCNGYNHANGNTNLNGQHPHGSHCMGTIAMRTNNGVGGAGIAGGKGSDRGVSIMSGQGFGVGTQGGWTQSWDYASLRGAIVSSNSWGNTSPGGYQQSFVDMIDTTYNRGMITVFASGNDDSSADWYPGYYDNVISVSALNWQGSSARNAASFTNYGAWLDVGAPGVNIFSSVLPNEGDLGGDNYDIYSGTSMACPHVAGLIALGAVYKPSANVDSLWSCLLGTTDPIDDDQSNRKTKGKTLGTGMINAPAFLNCLGSDALCGNGVRDAGEACDTAEDLSCSEYDSQYSAGLLACTDSCSSLSTKNCRKDEGTYDGLSASINSYAQIDGSDRLQVTIPAGPVVNILFSISGGGLGDADLYVSNSSLPNNLDEIGWNRRENDNECLPWIGGSHETCGFTTDGSQTNFYVAIQAYDNGNSVTNLTLTIESMSDTGDIAGTPTTSPTTASPVEPTSSNPTTSPTRSPTPQPTFISQWVDATPMNTFDVGEPNGGWGDWIGWNNDASSRRSNFFLQCPQDQDNTSLRCVRLLDNGEMHTGVLNAAGFHEIRIAFTYYQHNLDSNDDEFYVRIQYNGAGGFVTLATVDNFNAGQCGSFDQIFELAEGAESIEVQIEVSTDTNTLEHMCVNNAEVQLRSTMLSGTPAPSASPTDAPSSSPTQSPSKAPTQSPTGSPTKSPTSSPTVSPTESPSNPSPTASPSNPPPTRSPSVSPTLSPTTSPTNPPTQSPSKSPTQRPTTSPTDFPTLSPTTSPMNSPTQSPSESPTQRPTTSPTDFPTQFPTSSPVTSSPTTSSPTAGDTNSPTSSPSTGLTSYTLVDEFTDSEFGNWIDVLPLPSEAEDTNHVEFTTWIANNAVFVDCTVGDQRDSAECDRYSVRLRGFGAQMASNEIDVTGYSTVTLWMRYMLLGMETQDEIHLYSRFDTDDDWEIVRTWAGTLGNGASTEEIVIDVTDEDSLFLLFENDNDNINDRMYIARTEIIVS